MKLGGRHVHFRQHVHVEIIKRESHVHLIEWVRIHKEEVIVIAPLPMEHLLVPLAHHQLDKMVIFRSL